LKRKKKKRTSNIDVVVVLVVVAIVAIWGIYSLATPSTPSLTPGDFEVQRFGVTCHSDGGLDVFFQIGNTKHIPFHFVSATVVLLNYTLTNGTVVSGRNQQFTDNAQTQDTTHVVNGHYQLLVYPSNLMRNAWVMIMLRIGEVPDPFPLTFRIIGC
jgi:hypothetical protein